MITTNLHPWSLAVLRPDLSACLDAHPLDHQFRLVAADELAGEGYEGEAERMRWMARAGRNPRFYDIPGHSIFGRWGWYFGVGYRTDHPHYLTNPLRDLFGSPTKAGWYHSGHLTRQAAEDALIAFLLRFDRDPFGPVTDIRSLREALSREYDRKFGRGAGGRR